MTSLAANIILLYKIGDVSCIQTARDRLARFRLQFTVIQQPSIEEEEEFFFSSYWQHLPHSLAALYIANSVAVSQ